MLRSQRVFAALAASALGLTACGGADDSGVTSTDEPSSVATTPTATEPAGEGDPSETEPAAADTAETTTPPTEPASADIGPGSALGDLLTVDALPPAPEVTAPADFEQLLHGMFADLVDAVSNDPRAGDALMIEFLDRSAGQGVPGLALAVYANAAVRYLQLGEIIAAWLTAGDAAGYGADADVYLAPRIAFAEALNGQPAAVIDAAEGALASDWLTQRCVADNLLGDLGDCDEPASMELISGLMELLEENSTVEVPDDADRDLPAGIDICAIWDSLAVSPADLERLDLVIDDSYFDTRYLGRSECRYEAGLDEDPAWATDAGSTALRSFYDTVAAGALASGFDEDFYDNAPDGTYDAGKSAALAVIDAALVDGALDALAEVDEPRLRLGLIGTAVTADADARFQALWNEYDGDWDAIDELLAPCAAEPDACEPEMMEMFVISRSAQSSVGIAASNEVIDWDDDVENVYPICDIWTESLGAFTLAEIDAIEFAVNQLDIDELIGVGDCPRIADDSGATSG